MRGKKTLYSEDNQPYILRLRSRPASFEVEHIERKKRKPNQVSTWLNSVVLVTIFNFLSSDEQVSFRLVNQAINEELGISCDSTTIRYPFQLWLKYEDCISKELKEKNREQGRQFLDGSSKILNGMLRNYQITHSLPSDPFYLYHYSWESKKDENLNELKKNYLNQFTSGHVQFNAWICGSTLCSQASSCEIKILRKGCKDKLHDEDSYIYLRQRHNMGLNSRESTNDQFYRLYLSDSRKTLFDVFFYRDESYLDDMILNKNALKLLISSCELPQEWKWKDLLKFLLLCADAYYIRYKDYPYENTLERFIDAIPNTSVIEGENITSFPPNDPYRNKPQPPQHDYEYMYESAEDAVGRLFMSRFITENYLKSSQDSVLQIVCQLTRLRRIVDNMLGVSDIEFETESRTQVVATLRQCTIKPLAGTPILTSVGEYSNEKHELSEILFKDKDGLHIVIGLKRDTVMGYGSEYLKLVVYTKPLLEDGSFGKATNQITYETDQAITISEQFKVQMMGKSTVSDADFVVGLVYVLESRLIPRVLSSETEATVMYEGGNLDSFDLDQIFEQPLRRGLGKRRTYE